MIQEFFKTTLISKFIKQLLANSPVPIYKLIFDNDDMVEGCLYTYKDKILRCTKSGRFRGVRGTLNRNDYLYVQNPLRVNEGTMTITTFKDGEYQYTPAPFAVTDDVVGVQLFTEAEFDIVATLDTDIYVPGQTQVHISNISYYDEETHLKLGEYLRYLNNLYDLDLMPLYNCFNYKLASNMTLYQYKEQLQNGQYKVVSGISEVSSSKYKVYLVPIKFDKTYTIALESSFPVKMKAVFYNNGVMTDPSEQLYLSDYLDESVKNYNSTQFIHPITYTLTNTQAVREEGDEIVSYYSMLHNYERYLYLAIQVTSDNTSSLAVLEGDYTHLGNRSVADVIGIERDVNTADAVSSMLTSRLSLLEVNDGKHHPFADKLIQYLLRNTIDTREYIDENVSTIETAVNYTPPYQGMWDDNLRYILFERYMKLTKYDDLKFVDILGYVDSDIERAVRKGLIK